MIWMVSGVLGSAVTVFQVIVLAFEKSNFTFSVGNVIWRDVTWLAKIETAKRQRNSRDIVTDSCSRVHQLLLCVVKKRTRRIRKEI